MMGMQGEQDRVAEILRESEGAAMVPLRSRKANTGTVPNAALCSLLYPWKVLLLRDEVEEARTQHGTTECNRLRDEILPQLRKGMVALYERHESLHNCTKRYLQETRDGASASRTRHQLETALAQELPNLPEAIDPSAWFDRRESIEEWIASLVGKESVPG